MSGPRVFDGVTWSPITPNEGAGAKVAPVEQGDGTIFVSIASYRDGERCGDTLKALFQNAKNPDKIIVGLSEQNAPDDKFCIEAYCESYGVKSIYRNKMRADVTVVMSQKDRNTKCPHFDQIRLVAFHHISAKGPMFARSMVRKVLGNEEFCMQVDAHSDFVKDWDELAKAEWTKAGNEFGIISHVPPGTQAKSDFSKGGAKETEVPRQCRLKFRDNGVPDYESPADGKAVDLEKPLLTNGWSAAFSFAKCHLEESAPYDPFAQFALPVEQFSRFARFWTRGYDVYTPTRTIAFHDYGTQTNGHGNNEWFKRQRDRFRKATIQRMKTILQLPEGDLTENAQANLGIYGLGKRRSLEQLATFVNINMEATTGNVGDDLKCSGFYYVPYDASISPVANLYDNPDNLEPQPEYPLRTKLTFYERVESPDPGILVDLEDPNLARHVAAAANHHQPDQFQKSTAVDENSSMPSASLLFLLWVFGLIAWCAMFMGSGVPRNKATKASRTRKKDDMKDV